MALEARSPAILRFGVFEADVRTGELRKQGVRIKLQEQPFHVLTLLLQRPGEVVSREELRSHNWPADTFVDFDNSLNTAINKLREALGDSADNPRFIETLPRRGYRFIAPVSSNEGEPSAQQTDVRMIVASAVVVAIAAVVVSGLFLRWRQARLLTEKDTIVLADFSNSTGDPVFDDTLKQALAVQLQQSTFLYLVPDQQIRETMRLMEHSPNERVAGAVAQEVCQRLADKVVLQGTISNLGSHYVLTLNALTCRTGVSLAEEQAEVEGKERVLSALGSMASRLRRKLGESLALVEAYDTPIASATTASLEALRAFSLGVSEQDKGNDAGAIPFYKRAIELDPNFALAYKRLCTADWSIGEFESSREAGSKAFALRERVSERERLSITALYHDIVTGDLGKVIEADELLARLYPRDSLPHESLSADYSMIGAYDRALQEAEAAIRVAPDSAPVYGNLAIARQGLNQWSESRAALEQMAAKGGDSQAYCWLFVLAFAEGDEVASQKYLETGTKRVQESYLWLFQFNQAGLSAFRGKVRTARELVDAAVRSAGQIGLKQNQPTMLAQEALWEAQVGNRQRASDVARSVAKNGRGIDVELDAALALALSGDPRSAEKMANNLERTHPQDTVLEAVSLPLIRSTIALQRGSPEKALELLKKSEQYELGIGFYYFPTLMPPFIRGETYLRMGDGTRAAAEFQRVLEHRGSGPTSLSYVLAQLGLGRAQALAGNVVRARAAYQEFLVLWKDADPDIPILKQAKVEYAKLQ